MDERAWEECTHSSHQLFHSLEETDRGQREKVKLLSKAVCCFQRETPVSPVLPWEDNLSSFWVTDDPIMSRQLSSRSWANPNLSNSISHWLRYYWRFSCKSHFLLPGPYSCLFPTSSTKLKCWVALDSPLLSLGNSQSFQLRKGAFHWSSPLLQILIKRSFGGVGGHSSKIYTATVYSRSRLLTYYRLEFSISYKWEENPFFSPCFITTKVRRAAELCSYSRVAFF